MSTMENLRSYTKKALRAHYRQLRASLTPAKQNELDRKIVAECGELPIELKGLRYVLSYIPIKNAGEVNTQPVENWLTSKLTPAPEIAYPKTDFSTLQMEAILAGTTTQFAQTRLHLTEPTSGVTLAPERIDIVLVPLLTFDLNGYRVGYGKGFYDRFLARCRPDILKIGLSYLPPVRKIEDVDHFDLPLSYCVTPDRLYDFS